MALAQAGAFDVIVIGGGIVGCASAFFLMREGLRVALVERSHIGGGTTSNSFAWINATSKVADAAYHRLNAMGQAGFRALAVEFGEQRLGLRRTGMLLWVCRSHADRFAAVRDQFARLKSYRYPCAWIDNHELRALEPHVDFPGDAEGLYAMADPCLDAPHFTRFLAQELSAGGASVFEHCPAQALAMSDDGDIEGVVTANGVLPAGKVLVAAGPNTPEVLSGITGYEGFARFPVTRVPGLLVSTPSTAPMELVRHVIYAEGDDAVHVLPLPNGGLKLGADDTDGMVAEPDPSPQRIREAALMLLRRTRKIIPRFAGERCIDQCATGIGVRPYPQDGKTVAGELPGSNGLFVVATHSGVTLSPAVGSLIAKVIATGTVPEALAPFALSRFQGL